MFTFTNYDLTPDRLTFEFTFEDEARGAVYKFAPVWTYPTIPKERFDKYIAALQSAAFALGITELVSYWKAGLSETIQLEIGYFSEYQAAFFKDLYINGLSEFLYRNKLDTPKFEFVYEGGKALAIEDYDLRGNLVPVGGGKDSAVTLELLRKGGHNITGYAINPSKATRDCLDVAEISDTLYVTRTIDKELLRLNTLGYYNGHTPFSAIVAFSSVFFGIAYGYKNIILSNESGANEGNTHGVNHQYSKSVQFERDFRRYVSVIFGNAAPNYFSLLRPWSEYRIMSEFMKYPQYLSKFRSCNLGQKTDTWCGNCAKCLYVAVMLSAHLPDHEVTAIIGANMLDDVSYMPIMDGLCAPDTVKPFECVGTKNDVCRAVSAAITLREHIGEPLPYLLEHADIAGITNMELFDSDNFVPIEFVGLLA
ncbi:MAG: hypothetical protein LBN42_03945 [Oscillospiraceae bacterium]|jgi:hypothetical protein|nr:hypothetical protein [Oscillospiraceae bacterium]